MLKQFGMIIQGEYHVARFMVGCTFCRMLCYLFPLGIQSIYCVLYVLALCMSYVHFSFLHALFLILCTI